jgi:5-enolpyruvylshikimate-3-phosphate synthase
VAKPALKSTVLVDEEDLPDPQPARAMVALIAAAQTSLPEITRARYRTGEAVGGGMSGLSFPQ